METALYITEAPFVENKTKQNKKTTAELEQEAHNLYAKNDSVISAIQKKSILLPPPYDLKIPIAPPLHFLYAALTCFSSIQGCP